MKQIGAFHEFANVHKKFSVLITHGLYIQILLLGHIAAALLTVYH